MKSRFHQAMFESLAATLFDRLSEVESTDSLLALVSFIMETEVVALVRSLSGSSPSVEVLAAHPAEKRKWVAKNIAELRWWVGKKEPGKHKGFALERELMVGQRRFRDSLVAFGRVLNQGDPPQHELILLQKEEARYKYTNYQSAITATLLRHYEQIEELRYTKQIKRKYADLLSLDVLLECDWEEFVRKVTKEDAQKLQLPEFMGSAAAIATAYNIWGRTKGNSDKTVNAPLNWLNERKPKKKWLDFVKLTNFLQNTRPLDQEEAEIAMRVFAINDSGHKTALLVLEKGWRVVRESASGGCELPNPDQCKSLLKLTSELCATGLVRVDGCAAAKAQIGREMLRLYLALLMCGAPGLRNRYLWINQSEGDRCRNVPKEVRREFLLNIARYMLGVVEILQRRNQVVSKPQAVSNIEVLDGLLYAIDRFAHVELNVDERLKLRNNLGRGFFAEVNRHLSQHFYRDHLIHVIDVFLMGVLLLNTHLQWQGQKEQTLLDYITQLGSGNTTDDTQQQRLPTQWLRDWAVAALFHDLSYQSVSFSDPIKDSDAAHPFFALPRPSQFAWLDVCGCKSVSLRDKLDEMLGNFKDKDGQCWWLPKRGVDFKDHGILSALRLAQLLAHSECEDSSREDASSWLLINDYCNALHAIAHHNLFSCSVYFKTHPLSCLLRLCDELQEWGRRRVNIERIVKHLFLTIEDEFLQSATGHESLECLGANLEFSLSHKDDYAEVISRVKDNQKDLYFWLVYRNPVKAQYDAVTTFLSKAYNLQHVDLSISKADTESLKWGLILRFPRPVEYCGFSELDIYGLMREQERVLPEMWQFNDIHSAPPGLVWIAEASSIGEPLDTDCLAIIVRGKVDNTRKGWQTCNPGILRDRLIDLKRQLLASHTLGPKWRWLINADN